MKSVPEISNDDSSLAKLLEMARDGDMNALGLLFEQLRPQLTQLSQRELQADLQAKGGGSDLVQQSFLEAHRDFAGFNGQTIEQLAKWLQAILQSNIADFQRRYRTTAKRSLKQEVRLDDRDGSTNFMGNVIPSLDESPSANLRREEEDEQLDRAIASLPEQYQTAILLRHRENLSFSEIGQRMDRTAEAARKCWTRALHKLQEELDRLDTQSPD